MMHFPRYGYWNCEFKSRTVAEAALHRDLSAQRLHQSPYERQAEACTFF
jgi:hypothetical protein